MATHIIHKQQVVLEVPQQKDAFNYQDKISRLFANGLQTAVEKMLDEITPHNEVIRIDTLSIDLGEIEAKQFETEFKVKLVQSLQKAVLAGKAKTSAKANAITTSPATSQRDAFKHFVMYGSLPWYSHVKNMQAWEAELTTVWHTSDWQHIAQWVKDKQSNASILQRIVLQFSSAFLAGLAMHLYALTARAESIQAAFWQALHKDVVTINTILLNQPASQLNTAVWLDVFRVLSSDKASTDVENITARLIAKRLQDINAITAAAIITQKKELLRGAESAVVHDVLFDIITALEDGLPLSSTAAFILENKWVGLRDSIDNIAKNETTSFINGSANKQQGDISTPIVKAIKPALPEDVQYINNCGLVLLHPFIRPYFADLGLLDNKQFADAAAQQRAVLLLHYLATGETEAAEFNLGLQKLLCGYGLQETLGTTIELTEKEKEESQQLLRTVIDYWPPLKNTSVAGFQGTFLQREGRLSVIQSGWLLRIEQKAVDILLGKLPWGYSTIKLPWMDSMLNVEWA